MLKKVWPLYQITVFDIENMWQEPRFLNNRSPNVNSDKRSIKRTFSCWNILSLKKRLFLCKTRNSAGNALILLIIQKLISKQKNVT